MRAALRWDGRRHGSTADAIKLDACWPEQCSTTPTQRHPAICTRLRWAEALSICRRRSQHHSRSASIYWWLRAAVSVICWCCRLPESHVAPFRSRAGAGSTRAEAQPWNFSRRPPACIHSADSVRTTSRKQKGCGRGWSSNCSTKPPKGTARVNRVQYASAVAGRAYNLLPMAERRIG